MASCRRSHANCDDGYGPIAGSVFEWFGPGSGASSCGSDVRQVEPFQVVPHVITGLIPDRQKYALAFVVTCPVGMRLTEVTKSDRAIDG